MGDTYLVTIEGHSDGRRWYWLEGAELEHPDIGNTVIRIRDCDQGRLYCILNGIRDSGLKLVNIERLKNPKEGLS